MTSSTQPQCCFACLAGNLGNTRFACSNPSCECHQKKSEDDGPNAVGNQPRQEWEERFEEMEKNHGWLPEHKERIKFFISATTASERKALLEELLREMPKEWRDRHNYELQEDYSNRSRGFNEALTTIKSLIEKKLKI